MNCWVLFWKGVEMFYFDTVSDFLPGAICYGLIALQRREPLLGRCWDVPRRAWWKCEHWLEWQRSAQVTAALTDPVEIRGKAESLHSLCYKLQVIYLTSQFVQSCLLMVKMKQKVNILHSSLCYSDQSSIPSNGLLLLAMVWQLTAGIIFLLLLLPTLINRLWYSGKTPYSTFN